MVTKLIALLLFLSVVSSRATIALVQTNVVNSGSSTVTTLASSSLTFTKGNTIFVAVATGISLGYMSNNNSIAWRGAGVEGSSMGAQLFIGTVTANVTTTVTFNVGNASAIAMMVAEFSSTYSMILDQQTTNTTASTTTADAGTTQTTVNANELMIAALGHRLQSSTTTATFASVANSFVDVVSGTSTPTNTSASTNINTANNDREVDLVYKIVTATGTAHATATVTGSNSTDGVTFTFYERTPQGFFAN